MTCQALKTVTRTKYSISICQPNKYRTKAQNVSFASEVKTQ